MATNSTQGRRGLLTTCVCFEIGLFFKRGYFVHIKRKLPAMLFI